MSKPTKPFAWSYTALTGFENCPHRHWRTKAAKDIPDPPGDAATFGKRVHSALENRVKDKTPLPESMKHYEPYCKRFEGVPGQVIVEHQIALNKQLKPTSWFAKDAWCRGVIDVGVVSGKKALMGDWKTGKRKPDSEQMMLFAGLGFIAYPQVKVIDTTFIWLPDKKVDRETFKREDAADIWGTFLPRVKRMEMAYNDGPDAHPKKPSGLCNGWCPVKDCEFWKPRR